MADFYPVNQYGELKADAAAMLKSRPVHVPRNPPAANAINREIDRVETKVEDTAYRHHKRMEAMQTNELAYAVRIEKLENQVRQLGEIVGNLLSRQETTEQAMAECERVCGVVREPNVEPPIHVEGLTVDELSEMRDREQG